MFAIFSFGQIGSISVTKPHFINPNCFGEDLADWLKNKLAGKRINVDRFGQEDWGWYLEANNAGHSYLLGMNGIPDEARSGRKDFGEWRLIVKKIRSLGHASVGKVVSKRTTLC